MGNRIRNAFESVILDEKRKEAIINDVIDGTMKESKMKENKMSFWSGRLGGATIVVAAVLVFVVVNLVMFGGKGNDTPAVDVSSTQETTSVVEATQTSAPEETSAPEIITAETIVEATSMEEGMEAEKFEEQPTNISDQFTVICLPVKEATITADYGMGRVEMHEGVDFASQDMNIYAPMSGIIISMGYDTQKGNVIVIDHGNGVTSEYHHLAELKNELMNTTVSQGDVIGTMGSTGYATGVHLHWEIRVNGMAVNPLEYIEVNICDK